MIMEIIGIFVVYGTVGTICLGAIISGTSILAHKLATYDWRNIMTNVKTATISAAKIAVSCAIPLILAYCVNDHYEVIIPIIPLLQLYHIADY